MVHLPYNHHKEGNTSLPFWNFLSRDRIPASFLWEILRNGHKNCGTKKVLWNLFELRKFHLTKLALTCPSIPHRTCCIINTILRSLEHKNDSKGACTLKSACKVAPQVYTNCKPNNKWIAENCSNLTQGEVGTIESFLRFINKKSKIIERGTLVCKKI
jgi:hypothetical protein